MEIKCIQQLACILMRLSFAAVLLDFSCTRYDQNCCGGNTTRHLADKNVLDVHMVISILNITFQCQKSNIVLILLYISPFT